MKAFPIAYKLAAAVFAEVILFPLVLFPVSGCVRAAAIGARNFYDDAHDSIVFLCVPVVRRRITCGLFRNRLKTAKNANFVKNMRFLEDL
jgi:hypothetical protein